MLQISSRSKSRPIHIYKDNSYYFLSTRTKNKIKYFNNNYKKDILSDVIQKACQGFKINLVAWVILDNHYHLLIKIKKGILLFLFINNINANSARLINKFDNTPSRKIWYQYWDRCIRSEKDFWTRFNYIHHNPIKHGYIRNPDQLFSYKFSSYNQWLRKNGRKWMTSCFGQFPIVDFTTEEDL